MVNEFYADVSKRIRSLYAICDNNYCIDVGKLFDFIRTITSEAATNELASA